MSVYGDWRLVVNSPMGKQHISVTLRDDGGTLAGVLTNDANKKTAEIFDGAVTGDEAQWKVSLQDVKMTMAFDVTATGDSMSGKVKAGRFGRFGVSGQRAALNP